MDSLPMVTNRNASATAKRYVLVDNHTQLMTSEHTKYRYGSTTSLLSTTYKFCYKVEVSGAWIHWNMSEDCYPRLS